MASKLSCCRKWHHYCLDITSTFGFHQLIVSCKHHPFGGAYFSLVSYDTFCWNLLDTDTFARHIFSEIQSKSTHVWKVEVRVSGGQSDSELSRCGAFWWLCNLNMTMKLRPPIFSNANWRTVTFNEGEFVEGSHGSCMWNRLWWRSYGCKQFCHSLSFHKYTQEISRESTPQCHTACWGILSVIISY